MPILIDQIKESLENPQKRQTISKAASNELRLKLHSDVTMNEAETSRSITDFFSYVAGIIPADKMRSYLSVFTYPVKTTAFTKGIYTDLAKVFDGQNRVFKIDFLKEDSEADYIEYRTDKIKVDDFFRNKGFSKMKSGINSMIVVDLPSEQKDEIPEPYMYFLDIKNVIDFKSNGNEIEWVIFNYKKDQIAVVDNESYRVYDYEDKELKVEPLMESLHDLKYCPVNWFWDTPITYDDEDIKEAPLTAYIGELDWILFCEISKRVLDTYVPHPIVVTFEEDCDYDVKGESCSKGYLQKNNEYILFGSVLKACPLCNDGKLKGAGTKITVPFPETKEDFNAIDGIKFISGDVKNLEYFTGEIERQKEIIRIDMTGGSTVLHDQAKNTTQVLDAIEGKKNNILQLKISWEVCQTWTEKTLCLSRYGELDFKGIEINYGTEFYLRSASMIIDEYMKAKKENADILVLDDLDDQYYMTKFKNNPQQIERIRVKKSLDPFRHSSVKEVTDMFSSGHIKYEDFLLKINFSTILDRFEREQDSIIMFGSAKSYNTKIDLIKKILYKYALDYKPAVTVINEPAKI